MALASIARTAIANLYVIAALIIPLSDAAVK
jgi:hypothetical protein